MGTFRIPLSIAALAFVSGGIVMQFLVILSGSSAGYPTNSIYMLQAATDHIPTARNPTRWTFLGMCGSDGGPINVNCGHTGAAPPFNPPQNFATTVQVPWQFMETARFYYLSKAMFGFYLMATIFSVLCMGLSIPALFSLTGAFKGGFCVLLACLFQALAAALMTAWTVEGRDIFIMAGLASHVGMLALCLAWGAVGCFSAASILFVLGGVVTGAGPRAEREAREAKKNRGEVMEITPAGKGDF